MSRTGEISVNVVTVRVGGAGSSIGVLFGVGGQHCLDSIVRNLFIAFERTDVGGHEGLNTVAEAPGDLSEWYAGA